VLGAVPYAHTAVLLLDMDKANIPPVPFFAIKKRNSRVNKEQLQSIAVLLQDCLDELEKEIKNASTDQQKT
jgi:hypothetical protein